MTKTPERYWVGRRSDSQFRWLFDKDMPHEDARMVYLFNVDTKSMKEYPRAFARKVLTAAQEEDRTSAIVAYEKWHAEHGATFLKDDENRRHKEILKRNAQEEAEALRREAEIVARRQQAIVRHKEILERLGKKYVGVSENRKRSHRVTHCYACKASLDSDLHIECQSCSWLICYCGACGCGYNSIGQE